MTNANLRGSVVAPRPGRTHEEIKRVMLHLLRTRRGSARRRACADCGAMAYGWTYKPGSDPAHEQVMSTGSFGGRGRAFYSLDLQAWEPRCRDCTNKLNVRQRVRDGVTLSAQARRFGNP